MPEYTRRRVPFLRWYPRHSAAVATELCVGLDLTVEQIPPKFGDPTEMRTWKRFLGELVPAVVAEGVAVFKPQIGYYAAQRCKGLDLLEWLVGLIHELDMQAILDAKRNDIDRTNVAYGKEVFNWLDVDACTANTYLGETFMPTRKCVGWLPQMKQGCLPIWMIRTSNPNGSWLQDAKLRDGRLVYEMVASRTRYRNAQIRKMTDGMSGLGGVVGATYPSQAVTIRRLTGNKVIFLVPGYGVQGGSEAGAVAGAPTDGSLGLIINSSSGVTGAWQGKDGDPIENILAAIRTAKSRLYDARCNGLGYDPYAKALRRYLRQEAESAKAA